MLCMVIKDLANFIVNRKRGASDCDRHRIGAERIIKADQGASWASGRCFFSNTIEGAGLLSNLKNGFLLLMLRLLLFFLGFPVLTVLALSLVSELELEGP